jgi:hypothetical protein
MMAAMRALLLLLVSTTAAPVYAQTYKWIDSRGVVNYSNVPPAARAAQAQPIEDRVSVAAADPNLAAATAAAAARSSRQAELAHQEWLARQQGMMQAQALAAMYAVPAEYLPSYYSYGYGVPLVTARPVRSAVVRRVIQHHPRRL